ncbi:MAG TPA: branched-chain amino acid ABC transporter permease [Candidatus Methylomirabilis sp.]|nr:branched-chain amino acid ABC transporter permease [Candidatus Methylomirabilis sp.]HSD51360.1 branched-chain amino acid ABC transporter permease [Candidatus Methylomirabilis sp.]
MILLPQQIVFGVLVGSLYGLAAAGLSLVFGVLKILNVAHGELIMVGGYASFWIFALLGVDPFLALLLTLPIMLVVGFFLYHGLFAFVAASAEEARIRNSLLIGFGLTLVFHNLAVLFWTADERGITTAYSGQVIRAWGLVFPILRLGGLLAAFLVILGLHLFLSRTYLGKAIRATAEDWEAATLMGINIDKTYRVAFALGVASAGVAGTLVTIGYSVSPAIGLEWTLKALIVVVLAGLGSMLGTFVGGLLLGVAESASTILLGGAYREVVGLVLFLGILLARPQGLFGR